MLRVGLTGGIGSGKSTVARIFQVLNIPVYYADIAARRLMEENEELKKTLESAFGGGIFLNGKPDRKLLAEIVFNDEQKLQLLNSIVHPVTIRDAETWIHQQSGAYIIKEAALLFESGAHKNLDIVIGVNAPLELRIQRAITRDNITREQVTARIHKQMDEEIKLSLCDYVITNDERHLLIPQVLNLHEKFILTFKIDSSANSSSDDPG